MAALTYEKVIATISQTPDKRKDFEVNNLLPWFRKKSDLFRNLKTELLFDIIKHLQFVNKKRDDVIIRQGEQGDCMYILLRGQVTIYILYAQKAEGDDDGPSQPPLTAKAGESIRTQLGTFVCNLGAGATFGEVALLSDDCIRTASIIVNESTDLIVVDRDLYNRSVKNVLKKEFEDKSNFIANNPFFQMWAPKYKKQLAMALQKEYLPYEGMLCKQGDPVSAIYFILTGEVKVVMDPCQHKCQYPKICPTDEPPPVVAQDPENESVEDLLNVFLEGDTPYKERAKFASHQNGKATENGTPRFRKKSLKKQPQEVCLLSVNESIGDIEVLMDLGSYMQTAICTQRTEVLVLELKHYERLFTKRNPKTIEAMKEGVDLRIKTRISKHLERCIPILRILFTKAETYNQQKQEQKEARHGMQTEPKKYGKTKAEAFESFVPSQGPLIDQYGPGTVFHRIRQREQAKQLKQQKRGKMFGGGGYNSLAAAHHSRGQNNNQQQSQTFSEPGYSFNPDESVDFQTSDPVLTNLEERMRAWLANDTAQRNQPRIAKMQRSQTEADNLRPGAKVVIRTKNQEPMVDQASDEEADFHGSAWV